MSDTDAPLRVGFVGHGETEQQDLGGALADTTETLLVVQMNDEDDRFETHLDDVAIVVVVDSQPEQDGLAIFERIRERNGSVPVILVGEWDDAGRLETVLGAGVTDAVAVTEPGDLDALAARIRARASPPVTDGATVATRWSDITSALAHDVKNPMNVLIGRVDLVEMESIHEGAITRSIDTVVSLLDDLSTLGSVGQPVTSQEPVDVATVARVVWDSLDTDGGTLDVADGWTVTADEARLKEIFARLFENAIVHGGDGVTVSVQATDDGFAVMDDGPGIPEDERQNVLKQGYGTEPDGDGYGLFVAATAAEAHRWTVEVGESETGGARIEILTGSEAVAE